MPSVLYGRDAFCRYHGSRRTIPEQTAESRRKYLRLEEEKEATAILCGSTEVPQGNVDGLKIGTYEAPVPSRMIFWM